MIYTVPLKRGRPGEGKLYGRCVCLVSEEVICSWVDLRFFMMGGFIMGGERGGKGTNVMWLLSRGEPEGDNPPLVDVA